MKESVRFKADLSYSGSIQFDGDPSSIQDGEHLYLISKGMWERVYPGVLLVQASIRKGYEGSVIHLVDVAPATFTQGQLNIPEPSGKNQYDQPDIGGRLIRRSPDVDALVQAWSTMRAQAYQAENSNRTLISSFKEIFGDCKKA
jgi:hypothetical protein